MRFHMLPGGVLPWDELDAAGARACGRSAGTLKLQLDGRDSARARGRASQRLPGTLVIDHTGKFLEPVPVDHPGVRRRCSALARKRPHLCEALPRPTRRRKSARPLYDDVGALAKALRAARARSHAVGHQLAACPIRPASIKPDDAAHARPAARLGAGRGDPQRRSWSTIPRGFTDSEHGHGAKHRMAVIGLGMAVTPHAKSLIDLADRVEIAAAFSPTRGAPRGLRREIQISGLPAISMRSSPTRASTASLILTPPNTHLDLVLAAAKAGKHVLLEKPLEISTARARRRW